MSRTHRSRRTELLRAGECRAEARFDADPLIPNAVVSSDLYEAWRELRGREEVARPRLDPRRPLRLVRAGLVAACLTLVLGACVDQVDLTQADVQREDQDSPEAAPDRLLPSFSWGRELPASPEVAMPGFELPAPYRGGTPPAVADDGVDAGANAPDASAEIEVDAAVETSGDAETSADAGTSDDASAIEEDAAGPEIVIVLDSDGDGVEDGEDGCPADPAKQHPGACGCGLPDVDTDLDGAPDCVDECPYDPRKLDPEICGCGYPDVDSDGDGRPSCRDSCDHDPDKTRPGVCGCGVPDTDQDGDSTPDCVDPCPLDADDDLDGDGVCADLDPCPGDSLDDRDGDGVCGDQDNCPRLANPDQADADEDGRGDLCDSCTDTDHDGLGDPGFPTNTCPADRCPADFDNDLDGDGVCAGAGFAAPLVADQDNCPATANPDQADLDGDEIGDACDNCPATFNPLQSDRDGDVSSAWAELRTPVARPVAGEAVSLGDDDLSAAIPIGFDFEFFGVTYQELYISSNGFVTFDASSRPSVLGWEGGELPGADGARALIAIFWADLDPRYGGDNVRYQLRGEAPRRELVISFDQVPHFYGFDMLDLVSAQLVLHEGSNYIDLICLDCPSGGMRHSQGVEDRDEAFGFALPGRSAADFSLVDDAVRFGTNSDGFGDACDSCPDLFNPGQEASCQP